MRRKTKKFTLHSILNKNFPPGVPFHFIQVGAWDGTSYDFLYDFAKQRKATGLVIEPLPDYFEKLKRNYAYNPAIVAVNKAVFKEKKEIELFRVDPTKTTGLPDWAGGIASVDPMHHKKANIPTEVMIPQKVQADMLMNIIQEYYPNNLLNLFQVDVEGYDYEVLKQIDFNTLNPYIIRFEYLNLSNETTEQAIRLMKQHGYYCFYDDIDIIAIKLAKIRL